MKRPVLLAVALAMVCGIAFTLARTRAPGAPPGKAPEPVASVRTASAVKTRAPALTIAYGDIAPSQTQSISFSRPGQLAALNVVVGQRVAAGAPLARLAADPLAEATLSQARAALTLAEGEVQRTQQMFALQLATVSQVDTAQRAAKDARSNFDAQQKLATGPGANQATAPFDGVVMSLVAAQGDRLAAGAPVLQLGRADKLRVNLGIEPADLALVQVGDKVTLAGAADAGDTQGGPAAIEGRIASLQGLLDPRTRLVNAVVALPPEASRALVPGMQVKAQIVTGAQDGWSLPRQAVLTDDRGAYVYAAADGLAHRIDVRQLAQDSATVTVSGPLTAQTRVVSLGNYELADGMRIEEAKQ